MNIASMYALHDGLVRQTAPECAVPNVFCCGVELEIEDIIDHNDSWLMTKNIGVDNDGSLRNRGREYILPPRTVDQQVAIFHDFHSGKVVYGGAAFTERTSIHVHVNVLYSDEEQVHKLLMLYSIFEPLFFNYVGIERKNNIHCVPLINTVMSSLYRYPLPHIVDHWHKYTALNMLPVKTQGTVEFRHLEGTNDVGRFNNWLRFIECLWMKAHDKESLFITSNTINMEYLQRVMNELKTPAFVKLCKEPVDFILEDNLLDVKLSMIGN